MARKKILGGTCIYCFETITAKNHSPDHMFPETFYCTRDYMLHNVCETCNNTCGTTIEQIFCQDSIEGIVRCEKLPNRNLGDRHQMRRVKMLVKDEPGAGVLAGTYARPNPKKPFQVHQHNPQLVLHLSDGTKKAFTTTMLLTPEVQQQVVAHRGLKAEIMANTREQAIQFAEWLKSLGIMGPDFANDLDGIMIHEPKERQIRILFQQRLDDLAMRAICKIGFNYLAYVTLHNPEFVLHPAFNPIRRYIRYGEGSRFIESCGPALTFQDHLGREPFNLHLFGITSHDNRLRATVQLFDVANYQVRLTDNLVGKWDSSGHIFNCSTRKLEQIAFKILYVATS